MKNNISQIELSDAIPTINVNLPVTAIIPNQISVKSSESANIPEDPVTKQTSVKSEENSKGHLFYTPASGKDSSYEIKKNKKYYIFIEQTPKKKKIYFQKFIEKSPRKHSSFPDVVILDKLKIDAKKCKTPTPKKTGQKIENKNETLKDNFSLGYNPFDPCENEGIVDLNLNNINEWDYTHRISAKAKEKLNKEEGNYFNKDWIESLLSRKRKRKKKKGKNGDMKAKKGKRFIGFQFLK